MRVEGTFPFLSFVDGELVVECDISHADLEQLEQRGERAVSINLSKAVENFFEQTIYELNSDQTTDERRQALWPQFTAAIAQLALIGQVATPELKRVLAKGAEK